MNADLIRFIAVAQEIVDENNQRMGISPQFHEKLALAPGGRKYAKIVRCNIQGEPTSVHCFVDLATGDILKAESYKKPAKHARGNIHDEDGGAAAMTPYGCVYR